MQQAVIAGYVRTSFHFARKGVLAGMRLRDLDAYAIKAQVERTGIDPAVIDDVQLDCAYPESQRGNNIAPLLA